MAGHHSAGTLPRAFHMLGRFAGAPMAEAKAVAVGKAAIARSSGVITSPLCYHEGDFALLSNVMQVSCLITGVKTTIAERLTQSREAKGLTQEALARAAGVSQGTIGNIESGLRENPRELLAIAAAVGVSPQWLKSGQGPKNPPGEISIDDNPDLPSIRRVKFKLSAGASGFGVEYLDDDDEPIVFRRAWFESRGLNPGKLFAVRISNGSMQPGLWEDDTVVVNTADTTPKDGEVFAANYEGELVIKRLVRDEGRWWLKSDNPDQGRYPRKACDEHVVLLGAIVHKQSERI